jgi:hypothetical protein
MQAPADEWYLYGPIHKAIILRCQTKEALHRPCTSSCPVTPMPEGLKKQIDVPAMAGLLAYLKSIK